MNEILLIDYFLLLSLYLDEGELKTLEIALTTVGRGEMPLLKISKFGNVENKSMVNETQ